MKIASGAHELVEVRKKIPEDERKERTYRTVTDISEEREINTEINNGKKHA